MHDISLMQVAQSQHDLRANKLHSWLHEAAHFVDIIIYVATWEVLEEKVDLKFVLEDEVH